MEGNKPYKQYNITRHLLTYLCAVFFLYQCILMGTARGLGLHGVFSYFTCILTKIIVEKVKGYPRLPMVHSHSLNSPFLFPIPTPQKEPLSSLRAAASRAFLCVFKSCSSLLVAFQLSISSTDFFPWVIRAQPHHFPVIVLWVLSPMPGNLCAPFSF